MLIAEQHCNTNEKKIRPSDIGGVAGGTKFSVHGLFFKYPVDSKIGTSYLYGGKNPDDLSAGKATNHDFLGLTHCMLSDDLGDTNYPLLALIDYQGFRLTVMTELPLTKESLLYGSNNAGVTIKTNEAVHEIMKKISKKLNLRPHMVKGVEMALCGDVEIHQISNDCYFALGNF